MSAGTESIPNICAVCHAPEDREPMRDWGISHPYWLCKNQRACTERAQAQQRAAREAVRRAIAAEKAALQAEVAEAKAAVQGNGTGPLKAITDAAVAEMTSAADGEAGND